MRLIYWLVTALVALVFVVFAVSNRVEVALTLFPLPARLDAPLYLVVIVTLIVGFLLGEAVAWFGGSKRRAEHRALRKRHERLQRDLDEALPRADQKPATRP